MSLGLGLGISFGGAASAWSPAKLASLAVWLRPDASALTIVSQKVSAWADQSGLGDANKNVVQATTGARPTYNASSPTFNGQPSISLDSASSQFLQSGTWASPMTQPYSFFVVAKSDGTTTNQGLIFSTGLGAVELGVNSPFTDAGQGFMYAGAFLHPAASPSSAPVIIGGTYSSTSSKLFNTAYTPIATGDAGTLHFSDMAVGTIGGSAFWNGEIAEVVGVSAQLSGADLSKLFGYFATRYGISIGA